MTPVPLVQLPAPRLTQESLQRLPRRPGAFEARSEVLSCHLALPERVVGFFRGRPVVTEIDPAEWPYPPEPDEPGDEAEKILPAAEKRIARTRARIRAGKERLTRLSELDRSRRRRR